MAEQEPRQSKILTWLLSILPLGGHHKSRLEAVKEHFSEDELEEIKFLLKTRKIRFSRDSFGTSDGFVPTRDYVAFAANSSRPKVKERVDVYNKRLIEHGRKAVFESFAPEAEEKIASLLAPNLVGMASVKKAALLQLFAKEKFHILLLGDPSTGKTVILRSVAELAPISSFGLGSGTSKAGLTLSFSGKELIKGILPLADKGIACIDELNLMKNADRAGLLNAMEKGFITYDKGTSHVQLDARCNVFASANPTGDKFVGKNIDVLRKQIPFEAALLSRFHLMFLIRRPDAAEFKKIADQIIKNDRGDGHDGDRKFIKQYIEYALRKEVTFDKSLSPLIQAFVEDVRKDEGKILAEVSPRMVVGIVSLSKAAARMNLRDKVTKEDVVKAIKVFNSALYIKKDELEK